MNNGNRTEFVGIAMELIVSFVLFGYSFAVVAYIG